MVHWILALGVAGVGWAARGMYRQGFQWNFGGADGVAFAIPPAGAGTGPTTILQQFYQQTGPNNQQHIWVKQDGITGADAGGSVPPQDTIEGDMGAIKRKIAGFIGL